jgi:hypothetical protein
VGFGSTLPFLSIGNTTGYRVEGHPPPGRDDFSDAMIRVSSGDYLQTLGVHLVEGRLLRETDTEAAQLAAVINETMARRYFPGQSALGRRLTASGEPRWRTIVGVIRDVRERGYELAMKPALYVPRASATSTPNLIIRSAK